MGVRWHDGRSNGVRWHDGRRRWHGLSRRYDGRRYPRQQRHERPRLSMCKLTSSQLAILAEYICPCRRGVPNGMGCLIASPPTQVRSQWQCKQLLRYAGREIRYAAHPGLKAEKYAGRDGSVHAGAGAHHGVTGNSSNNTQDTDGTDDRDLTDRAPAWNFRD